MKHAVSAEIRFWRRVVRGPGCWLWTGRVDRTGYGVFSISRSTIVRAQRQSWVLHHGAPPERACVLQRCGERRCVNPEHLYLGSPHEQDRERVLRPAAPRVPRPSSPRGARHWTHLQTGKVRRGARSNLSKLSAEQVREIRALYEGGLAVDELARRFAVVAATITNIVHYRTWRDVTPPAPSESARAVAAQR